MVVKQSEHLQRISLDAVKESVEAEPKVACSEAEIEEVLRDLGIAVDRNEYVPQTPTVENPALSDDYIFDTEDQNMVLKDLKRENFVGKIRDFSKGAIKRKQKGLPDEYLYVFRYACRLFRRDTLVSATKGEVVLIYIKINNRRTPYRKVFIVSFHKNRTKNN